MRVADALKSIARLGLDTAPIIYFVEGNPQYHSRCAPFFTAIDAGNFEAVTSAITLPEALVHPLRNGDSLRTNAFRELLLATHGISTEPMSLAIAERTAQLRADYNLRTPDAIQLATAILSGCDTFLTNDAKLKRVVELRVLVVDELSL